LPQLSLSTLLAMSMRRVHVAPSLVFLDAWHAPTAQAAGAGRKRMRLVEACGASVLLRHTGSCAVSVGVVVAIGQSGTLQARPPLTAARPRAPGPRRVRDQTATSTHLRS
jgi:hypothetical protein